MEAIIVAENGSLRRDSVPTPAPRSDEVLIKVAATAVNRADLLQRIGKYPPPPGTTDILGLECSGEVVALGDSVTTAQKGDNVSVLLPGGGYAEYVVAPAGMILPQPRGVSIEYAAAIPEAFYTAYLNLMIGGALNAGELCLIYGAAGGVGTAAIQIARAFGAQTIAVAGAERKLELCNDLGAAYAINYRTENVQARVDDISQGRGVDVILDMVGGAYLESNIAMLAFGGRMMTIGLLSGAKGQLDMATVLRKNLRIAGATLRNKSLQEKLELTESVRRDVWPLFESGVLAPVIDTVMPLRDAEQAHARMKANLNLGKIVLRA